MILQRFLTFSAFQHNLIVITPKIWFHTLFFNIIYHLLLYTRIWSGNRTSAPSSKGPAADVLSSALEETRSAPRSCCCTAVIKSILCTSITRRTEPVDLSRINCHSQYPRFPNHYKVSLKGSWWETWLLYVIKLVSEDNFNHFFIKTLWNEDLNEDFQI